VTATCDAILGAVFEAMADVVGWMGHIFRLCGEYTMSGSPNIGVYFHSCI